MDPFNPQFSKRKDFKDVKPSRCDRMLFPNMLSRKSRISKLFSFDNLLIPISNNIK